MTSTIKNIIVAVGIASLTAMTSCVKPQEQIFDKSSSVRVQELVLGTRDILTSADNGWLMYYYPHSEALYGGYIFAMEFGEDGFVTVYGDSQEEPASSLFTTKMEDGAVLTVDTGNKVFQQFATPTSSMYQAYKGDFEFVIQSASASEILLRGRRTANYIKMVPITGTSAQEYMASVRAVRSSLAGLFEGALGSSDARVNVLGSTRHAEITIGEENVSVPFFYTPDGISFFTPGVQDYLASVDVAGNKLSGFDWNADSFSISAPATDGIEASLVLKGWHSYEEYIGKWEIFYNEDSRWPFGKTAQVELVENEAGKSYLMKGMNANYDFRVDYVSTSGSLLFLPQIVAPWGERAVAVAAFTLNSISAGSSDEGSAINVSGYNVKAYGESGWQTTENETLSEEAGALVLEFSAYNSAALGADREFMAFGLLIVQKDGSWSSYGNGAELNAYHVFDNARYIAPFWKTMTKK